MDNLHNVPSSIPAVPLGLQLPKSLASKKHKSNEGERMHSLMNPSHNFASEWERHHFGHPDVDSDALYPSNFVAPALPVSLPSFYNAKTVPDRSDFESLTALRANVFERDLNLHAFGDFDPARAFEVSPDRVQGERVMARRVVRAQLVNPTDEPSLKEPFVYASQSFDADRNPINRRKLAAKNRAKLVCTNCHKSKTRCHGGFPCARCIEYEKECIPRTQTKKRGRPKTSDTDEKSPLEGHPVFTKFHS